jgi:hypothetical protein
MNNTLNCIVLDSSFLRLLLDRHNRSYITPRHTSLRFTNLQQLGRFTSLLEEQEANYSKPNHERKIDSNTNRDRYIVIAERIEHIATCVVAYVSFGTCKHEAFKFVLGECLVAVGDRGQILDPGEYRSKCIH